MKIKTREIINPLYANRTLNIQRKPPFDSDDSFEQK